LLSSQTTRTTTATAGKSNPILDKKIDEIGAGIPAYSSKQLHNISAENAAVIVEYIFAMKNEVNLSDHYRKGLIDILTRFCRFIEDKPFKQSVRADVIAFLETFRKSETQDPLHKWIGTYNLFRVYLLRFFKWLYYPDIEPGKRPKPSVVENIAHPKRKEQSIYKPSDLWTQQDDLLFLKYCPSKRVRCYHAISRDLSCRPHEILKLKIRDLAFKSAGPSTYVEVVVNGKTGTRAIPLINSIPYLKDYLDHEHPQPRNPNAPLISGTGASLRRHIRPNVVYRIYDLYKRDIS